jgi:integrase
VAAAYIRARRREWSNIKHARQWTATLKTYARPVIGTQPVDTITTEDILGILQPIWNTKTETAKRVQGRMENIFDFAAARKWRDPINPARWRGHLDKLLASPTKSKKQRNGGVTRHQPALPYQDVPGFVEALRTLDSISAKALEFLILTACRTTEVLDARWDEIDLNSRVWTIPAVRMKARREHRVPLSERAFTLLSTLPRITDNEFIFFGARHGRPRSNMALLQLMRGIGYGVGGTRGDAVPHGFRSSFRDWAGEVSSFPNHVCEMALAHVVANKAEAAYRRGDLFDKRRAMMEEWARWCEGIQDDPGLVARRAAPGLRTTCRAATTTA